MSSCLSGGGRTYALDLEIIKSQSSSSARTSQTSSSPSSTLSESSNSPLAISTRKPRTPRKRPNQTYNEAAALLSTAYPNIFSSKSLTKFTNHPPHHDYSAFPQSPPDLLLPFRVFDDSGFLLRNQPIRDRPSCLVEPKVVNSCGEVNSHGGGGGGASVEMECFSTDFDEDFDAESMLDEEIEEGIDSIMGNLSVKQNGQAQGSRVDDESNSNGGPWYGNPMGLGFGGKIELGFGFGLGLRRGIRALRHVDEGNWWNFPTVDVLQISPKTNPNPAPTPARDKKKTTTTKKKKVEKQPAVVSAEAKTATSEPPAKENGGLQLKLNYEEVVNAWSDRGCPFSDELSPGSEPPGNDVYARLAQIDLFSDGGGVREASVLRYKEKRRTRLFSKKIRYQVRKVNADRRPRMKGRFVRRPNSSSTSEERLEED